MYKKIILIIMCAIGFVQAEFVKDLTKDKGLAQTKLNERLTNLPGKLVLVSFHDRMNNRDSLAHQMALYEESIAQQYADEVRVFSVDIDSENVTFEWLDDINTEKLETPYYLLYRNNVKLAQVAPKKSAEKTDAAIRKQIEKYLK